MEQKRQELLDKYQDEIIKDFGKITTIHDITGVIFCSEFQHLVIDSDPEFAIRVLESLYGKNKLEILK